MPSTEVPHSVPMHTSVQNTCSLHVIVVDLFGRVAGRVQVTFTAAAFKVNGSPVKVVACVEANV